MLNAAILYTASLLTALWGIAHLLATRGAIAGFGAISIDNRRIITMEWIVEGVALLSIGAFVATATAIHPRSAVSIGVYAVSAVTLIVLALVSLLTGFRVQFPPYRLCPFIFGLSALLILWAGIF